MKKPLEKKLMLTWLILFIVIALQLFRIIYSYAYLKEDYHSDEQWSYGLSNSYYEPFIYADDDCIEAKNFNEWIPGDTFRDYLTVGKDHRFSYGSVFYNQEKDVHPPLYYLILHTICSFFPGQFSFWYAFTINIISFVIIQIYLFRIIRETSGSDTAAISGCLLYGLSTGCLNTFVFLRMYSLMTMFAVILSFLHVRLFSTGSFRRYLPWIFAVTLAGCLTNHFFPVYAGALSACFCLYYLFKKKFRNLIIYAAVMLMSVITSIIIFPATIPHLTSPRIAGAKYSLSWQIKMCINLVLSELFSFSVSVFHSPVPGFILMFTGCLAVMAAPVLFLFRKKINSEKIKNFIKKAGSYLIKIPGRLNKPVLFLFTAALASIIATAMTVSMMRMNHLTDRYIFFIFPVICAVFIFLLNHILKHIFKNSKIISILLVSAVCLLSLRTGLTVPCQYLFEKPEGCISIAELTENSNCIYITADKWELTYMTDKFMNCSKVFPVLSRNAMSADYTTDDNTPLFLAVNSELLVSAEESYERKMRFITGGEVVQNNASASEEMTNTDNLVEEELLEYIENSTGKKAVYTGYDSCFGRKYNIYSLK